MKIEEYHRISTADVGGYVEFIISDGVCSLSLTDLQVIAGKEIQNLQEFLDHLKTEHLIK